MRPFSEWLAFGQFPQSPCRERRRPGCHAAVKDKLSGVFTRAPKNREIRYRITTGSRHAHISPNVVNNALTKLKKLQRRRQAMPPMRQKAPFAERSCVIRRLPV
jgi:hypothetical protein